jgi:ATP phosphoribosyltransferase
MSFVSTIEPMPTVTQEADGELFERFQAAETKIAIQKDGELTEISRYVLGNYLGVELPNKDQRGRELVAVSEDGRYGFAFARNKSICSLVGKGAVDLAIVGIDRVIEDQAEDEVAIIADFRGEYCWPLVVATRADSPIKSLGQISRVATQYPVMSDRYFNEAGITNVDIVPTQGSTELFPYLDFDGPIDAIVDMSITGRSLAANNLVKWLPQIADIYPVLIEPKKTV